MPLGKWDRKERLGHGAQREIAKQLGDEISEADVSRVMNEKASGVVSDEKIHKIKVAVARRLRMSVAEAFPETEAAA